MFELNQNIITCCVELSEPCLDHSVLDDAWRNIGNHLGAQSAKCDDTITLGWYRIKMNGSSSQLLSSCPAPQTIRPNICGTHAPLWFNGARLCFSNPEQYFSYNDKNNNRPKVFFSHT